MVPSDRSRSWYSRRLRILTSVMDGRMRAYFQRTGEVLTPADRTELARLRSRFTAIFDDEARPLATRFFERSIRYTQAAFIQATKPIVDAQRKDLEDRKARKMASRKYEVQIDGRRNRLELHQFREGIEANVNLIKTIPSQYFDKVQKAVEARTRGKMTRKALIQRIYNLGGITRRRAAMIADDQAAKACEAMMLARCRNAGVKRVVWLHTGTSVEPRDYHKRKWDGHSGKRNGRPNGLNGFVFNLNEPPVIDLKTGERGYPAQLINCRCSLAPVITAP